MFQTTSERSYRTYDPSSDAGISGDDFEQDNDLDLPETEAEFEPATPSRSTLKRGGKKNEVYEEDEAPPSLPAFDAYFTHATRPSRTSANVFSQLAEPLSTDEYASAIALSFYQSPSYSLPDLLFVEHQAAFPQYLQELDAGFNILFYGLGSKRQLLNHLVSSTLSKKGEVIVINGFHPNFSMKDLIPTCDKLCGASGLPLTNNGVDGHFQRVSRFFASKSCKKSLYIVVHNLDATPLRTAKAKAQLSTLLSCPKIHVIASFDHLNAPLLFSTSSLFSATSSSSSSTSCQKAWVWHDLTSLASYDTELAFADKSSLRGAATRSHLDVAAATSGGAGAPMSESAAQHILLSVTAKAKKLFALLARHQLDADAEAEGPETDKSMAYDQLFNIARNNFVATSDGALRALLGEFRDHGLVVTTSTGTLGAAEMLSIPMRKERLAKLMEWMQQQSGT
jgi:origin recognition complex subunit 2